MRSALRTPTPLVLLLAAPALVGTLSPSAARAGEIVLKDGKVLNAEIKEATFNEVKFKLGGSVQTRRADEVARLHPTDDRDYERALKLVRKGDDASKAAAAVQRVIERGDDVSKPCAQFLLAELYERNGDANKAVAEYDKVAADYKQHFYAPVALERAADLSSGGAAVQRLERLASGEFGKAWQETGQYGKARILLAQKNLGEAKKTFSALGRSALDKGVQGLARCGEAHCQLLEGDAKGALRRFKDMTRDTSATLAARGYAWVGVGLCSQGDDDREAMLALLRGVLLYPSNPVRREGAKAAAELARKLGLGGDKRLEALGASAPYDDYGADDGEAELMRRSMQFVSAEVPRQFAEELAKKVSNTTEKADLEFLGADALKVVARAKNDADMLAEYENKLKALKAKHPNHQRAALASIDAFMAAKDRALAVLGQAGDEPDESKRDSLLEEGRSLFKNVIEPFKGTIAEMSKEVEALAEKDERGELDEEGQNKKHETEFRRDLAEFLLAESYASYARTFADTDAQREENLKKALAGYDFYINNRGNYQKLLYYSYIGRGEMLMELKQYDDAVMQYEELTFIEPAFLPEDPEGKKAVLDMIKDICIRAYYGLTRALLMAGKSKEAYEASKAIDENPKAEGWRDHPMGILLTFERAKALAGAGRGAQGADELYDVIEKSKEAPDADKIPGLGMTKLGAGACRALSELSDVTGGEIYSPEIQFYVGIGYFLRRRPDLAAAAYKGVLTAAQTKKQREEWVPKAVREIGDLLFQQERYLEAAIAYQTVFVEFPDHPMAEEAVRFAVSASKKAIEQFGEDPTNTSSTMVSFAKRIESSIGEAAGPEHEAKLILKDATDLHGKQKWLQAAQRYLDVKADYTDDKGQKKRISFYPNAIANAGYCFFQAYQKEGQKDEHLKRARESLQTAAKVAAEMGDTESQALASFYLGQIENQLDKPAEALRALAPFDGPLSGTGRYIVRARYEQAMACLAQGGPDGVRKAESYFKKVEDKTGDEFFEKFAYSMANELRGVAVKTLKENGNAVDEARALRAKAGRYAKLWADNAETKETRSAVLFWVGGLLFDGGQYRDAARLYDVALKNKRPDLDGGRDQKAIRENFVYDAAELQLGYGRVLAGDFQAGIEALNRIRNCIYVKEKSSGNKERPPMRRGVFVKRELKGPYSFKFQGRQVQRKVWFTTLDVDGTEVEHFDAEQPRLGDSEFYVVEGKDPSAAWQPGDVRVLERPYLRDYLVVDGLARATWGLYQQNKDKNFLAKEVTEASNELRYVLRGMDEGSYGNIVGGNQLEPASLNLRTWQADVDYLRIKLERESWREVLGDIEQMDKLGRLKAAPPEILAQIQEIKQNAESHN